LLPAGAHVALAGRIGHHDLEDLLILPGAAWAYGWLPRRCLYTPLRVLGAGDRAVALWVQALPVPGIRAVVPFSEIAAITLRADGTRRQLVVTGHDGRLPVRYDAASDVVMNVLIRRLRRRAAGDPAPVPAGYPMPASGRSVLHPDLLRLEPDDEIAAVGQHGRAGRRTCLLAVTPRELIIVRSLGSARPPGRVTDWVYVPRRAIEEAGLESDSLLLHGAGLDLRVTLRPGRAAMAASAWLGQLTSGHDRSGAGS